MNRKINTVFVNPPIPVRHMDWMATFDGYEPGDHIGFGQTQDEAIEALQEQTANG